MAAVQVPIAHETNGVPDVNGAHRINGVSDAHGVRDMNGSNETNRVVLCAHRHGALRSSGGTLSAF